MLVHVVSVAFYKFSTQPWEKCEFDEVKIHWALSPLRLHLPHMKLLGNLM